MPIQENAWEKISTFLNMICGSTPNQTDGLSSAPPALLLSMYCFIILRFVSNIKANPLTWNLDSCITMKVHSKETVCSRNNNYEIYTSIRQPDVRPRICPWAISLPFT